MDQRPKRQERPTLREAAPPVLLEDVRLIEKIRAGQTEAFGELVQKYQDRVFNTCWRICGNLEDARDVTQDSFLKAFEKLGEFRRESGFFTWLFRIAVNQALTQRRSAARRRTVSLDDDGVAAGSQARKLLERAARETDRDPVGVVGAAELHGRVARAVQELEDDFRAVVVLRDIEGMDYQTIAEILEIPPGTVKSRLHRARMILSEAIRPAPTRQR